MSETLLAMAIGPVQEFIAAARRTRDLWFGSHVLSEISKAAAKAVADRIGNNGHQQLIFPSPEDATELEPADNETRLAVANVILARLPDGVCASEVANTARAAAQKRWKEFAEKARGIAGRRVRIDVWQEQVDDVVEFYSAWQPLPSDSAYRETRRQVMRLLGARKACRDFLMSSERDERLPKSSLDGARDTVLQKGTRGSDSLRLAHNEQLDVVGLTKRRAGGLQSFPSVASVAAHSWLQVAAEQASAQFDELKAECDKLSSGGLISRSPSPLFPFDGTAVFLNRHESIAEEAGIAAGERKSRTADLSTIVGHLQRPQSKGGCGLGEASAYLAVLVADGDRMGAVISEITTPDDHQKLSRQLTRFAERARKIVEESDGVCIYAGGDDVLALVPLDRSLMCSRQLHDVFGELLGEWKTQEQKSPTLSVGLAVGHFMEPMEDLLSFGREAEKVAKTGLSDGGQGERNALAVMLRTRGAAPISVRDNWRDDTDESSIDQRLQRWCRFFERDVLPGNLPYDLRKLADEYRRWPEDMAEAISRILEKDIRRLVRRKQTKLGDENSDAAEQRADRAFFYRQLGQIQSVQQLDQFAAELLVAQHIRSSLPKSARGSKGEQHS